MSGDIESIIITLVVGFVAGLLAGMIMGKSNDVIINIVLGILGAFVGGYVLTQAGVNIGTGTPIVDRIITATIGAVIIIFLVGIFRKASK